MKAFSIASLAAAALLSLSGTAHAAGENGHAYNGSYCSSYFGTQATHFNNQYNGIRNNQSSGRYVSCPVIVDEISTTTGTTRQWMHFAGTGKVTCTIYSMNGPGSIRQSRTTSRVNSGWFSMPALTTDDYWGSYSMWCYLPARGTLNTIWLGEKI